MGAVMSIELETRIRARLHPFLIDGSEAVERIVDMLHSPSRPKELRRALAAILRLTYRDTVRIDDATNTLLCELENETEKGL
jgi:hypothetical protein